MEVYQWHPSDPREHFSERHGDPRKQHQLNKQGVSNEVLRRIGQKVVSVSLQEWKQLVFIYKLYMSPKV